MKYILVFGALCLLSHLSAQPIQSIKPLDAVEEANFLVEEGDFFNALELYRIAQKELKSDDLAVDIAYCYYKLRDFKNAERNYARILKKDIDNLYVDDRYAYGRSLRSLDSLRSAREQFKIVKDLSTSEELRKLADRELEGISMMGTYPKNEELTVSFSEGKINTGSGEYSPALFDDQTLYYTSFDRNKEIVLDGKESKYHAKIYKAVKGKEGFEKPEELSNKINRPGYHVGNVSFSQDRRRMYYTRQLLANDTISQSTIYYSNLLDDEWSAAEPLPNVNGEWIAKQPAEGELLGQRVLFFVSDMDGGLGGDDIYYVPISDGSVGQPVNLGPQINTVEDEITPHYYDGKLYFSTDARPGIGGYDIFFSKWDGRQWSKPQNAGHQYNSPLDDFYLYFDQQGVTGYLVSNRPDEKKRKMKSETCCYDIYQFNIRQLNIDLLVGVGDAETEKPLDGATVELTDITIDKSEEQTLPEEYRFHFDLNADRRYRVITSKEGYLSDTLEFSTYGIIADKSLREKVLLEKLPPAEPDQPQVVIDTVTINEAIRFDNIYYDFDKWDILPASEEDLTIILNLLNEYPDMVIELSSHTDARGYVPYNANLSQKRAESAKKWLTDRGVASDRIVAKGYGESKILNRCVNGVQCTDEEHRFNRRTEFKILEGPESIEIKRVVTQPARTGGAQSRWRSPRILGMYETIDSVPVVLFAEPVQDLGTMITGEKKEITYLFANVGTVPLIIEHASACKCTDIRWPQEPIPPGGQGRIVAIFDSSGMTGTHHKTIDIIANTDPIVVEAKFDVHIIPKEEDQH